MYHLLCNHVVFHNHLFCDPYGSRTRVFAVKGRCPRPLDERTKSYISSHLLNGHLEPGLIVLASKLQPHPLVSAPVFTFLSCRLGSHIEPLRIEHSLHILSRFSEISFISGCKALNRSLTVFAQPTNISLILLTFLNII